jgi:alkanesulfonate monooxygenase SsuD/methylene tetrahydromethanopterin reductase-like flavin-dependent oxidoreductase (luciferase family)
MNVRGENEIEAALRRLDRLTSDESRATAAQTLEVVYGLVRHRRVVLDGEKAPPVQFFACY